MYLPFNTHLKRRFLSSCANFPAIVCRDLGKTAAGCGSDWDSDSDSDCDVDVVAQINK